MKVIFRVDSSTQMGSGHLMRCLTLAEALRDQAVQVSFVCRELPGNLISLLRTKDIPVTVLPAPTANPTKSTNDYAAMLGVSQAEDAEQTLVALNKERPDCLIVDHYGLNIEWEQSLRPQCKRLMVIDDLANRSHDCDVLLDQNYSVDSTPRYLALVPPSCKVLLGLNYALLRKEFQTLRQQQANRTQSLKQLLVFFTAGDDQGETLKAMQGIALFDKAVRVDVVIGKGNPDMLAIKAMCAVQHWSYHCQVDYMPALIAQADLVIGGGGSSNWERCSLGIPALVVILAENQAAITKALDSAGVIINLGWNTTLQAADYATALNAMTTERLAALAERAFQLVDAIGAQRVVEILVIEQAL
jgi:UDP-2,4-diacetamido-2,4,6-trideoxy-beta-L-altropyranose hydrolase